MPYNSASLIDIAEISIMYSDGITWDSELTYCDGSNQAIFDARQCVIPSTTLRDPPFSLA